VAYNIFAMFMKSALRSRTGLAKGLLTIAGLVALYLAADYGFRSYKSSERLKEDEQVLADAKNGVKFSDLKDVTDGNGIYVTGVVHNTTLHFYPMVQARIDLKDGRGSSIGDALVDIENLGRGVKQTFKSMAMISGVKSVSVSDITAYQAIGFGSN
jgi:hypothetical protein